MKKVFKKISLSLMIFGIGVCVTLLYTNNKYKVYEEEETKQIKKHVDTISMMLETEAGSGNYEMTTRENWPKDGYVFNTELSKCENGGELLWDDENKRVLMSGNVSDKCYVYFDKVLTLADYVKSLYTGTQGENGIYYHDSSLTNGAGDNSYRYAGASEDVNNFVCFGTNASPCPADNLYRMIGVFGDKVKLIKYEYVNSDLYLINNVDSNLLGTDGDYKEFTKAYSTYKGSFQVLDFFYWNNSTQKNTWSESLLNKTNLNTNFIINIGSEWSQKIATTTWKVGGSAGVFSVPSVTYQNEVVNPEPGSTSTTGETEYTSQIGLMYVSDYGFAADPGAWTTSVYNYDGSVNDSTIRSLNWMYMGMDEWTITRIPSDSDGVYLVSYNGNVNGGYAKTGRMVRPSFSLLSSIIYKSGSGTQSDPILIN